MCLLPSSPLPSFCFGLARNQPSILSGQRPGSLSRARVRVVLPSLQGARSEPCRPSSQQQLCSVRRGVTNNPNPTHFSINISDRKTREFILQPFESSGAVVEVALRRLARRGRERAPWRARRGRGSPTRMTLRTSTRRDPRAEATAAWTPSCTGDGAPASGVRPKEEEEREERTSLSLCLCLSLAICGLRLRARKTDTPFFTSTPLP